MSISAKKNNNIDKLFEEIGKKLYKDFIKNGDKVQNNININHKIKKRQTNCCIQEKPDI